MNSQIMVSIQVTGFSDMEQLKKMIAGIARQKHDFSIKLNIQRSFEALELDNYIKMLKEQHRDWQIELFQSTENDFWGLRKADGTYIAFCQGNDFWSDEDKLIRQVHFLEQNEPFIASVHDVDLIDGFGLSYNYASQQKYKKNRYSANKLYSWSELQYNVFPAAISTLVCRNFFNEKIFKEIKAAENINPELLLYALISFNGTCFNFYNQQMVKKTCKSTEMVDSVNFKGDSEWVRLQKSELNDLITLAANGYQYEFNPNYKNIYLAICYFEFYIQSAKTTDDIDVFLTLYDEAHRTEYDCLSKDLTHITAEKDLFNLLRYRVERYQLKWGNVEGLSLLKYSRPATDDIRIEYIMRCYAHPTKANRQWRRILIRGSENISYVKRTVRYRLYSAPFRKVKRKAVKAGKFVHKSLKRVITRHWRKKGFSAYMANEWYDTVRVDLMTDKNAAIRHKIWCYRRGFMPWRLPQYGANQDNYHNFLSDRDYMYLHQINNSYKKWIEDKMTLRYVLEPFKEYLPEYYFQIIRREGYPIILPLMDCPEGYKPTFDDLFRLLRDKGKLALKAASGTHGIGFYKLSYEDKEYYLNNRLSSEYEITKTIRGFKSFYIVTEYVTMHDTIKQIYGGSVNTIRVLMINSDGFHPQLLDSYMRIGSSKSGVTDNIAFGGVTCRVDINTGEYNGGEQLADHKYTPCTHHPDTNTLIEGIVPHWETIKEKLIELCKYIGQLEYLGFDIVATPDSFCILEINSHQDLQKFPLYDAQIKKFLFDKLERKCKIYHINRK